MWKKLAFAALAIAATTTAAPVFADPPHGWGRGRHAGYDDDAYRYERAPVRVIEHRYYPTETVVIERPVIVERPVIIERPAVVYREVPSYYEPGPRGSSSGLGAVGGAIAGAVIGSRFGGGDGRIAAIALGTVLGAHVGEQLSR